MSESINVNNEKGIHFEFIKSAIPECLVRASPQRRKVLKDTKPSTPQGYERLTVEQQVELKALIETGCDGGRGTCS